MVIEKPPPVFVQRLKKTLNYKIPKSIFRDYWGQLFINFTSDKDIMPQYVSISYSIGLLGSRDDSVNLDLFFFCPCINKRASRDTNCPNCTCNLVRHSVLLVILDYYKVEILKSFSIEPSYSFINALCGLESFEIHHVFAVSWILTSVGDKFMYFVISSFEKYIWFAKNLVSTVISFRWYANWICFIVCLLYTVHWELNCSRISLAIRLS